MYSGHRQLLGSVTEPRGGRAYTSSIFKTLTLIINHLKQTKIFYYCMWRKGLNWEWEMLHMCFHMTVITVRSLEANQISQVLTAGELCLIWCVQHSTMGTIAESSATVSSTSVHAWARYLTVIANLSCLFFFPLPLLSRGLEYMRVKCKPTYPSPSDLFFCINREHNSR